MVRSFTDQPIDAEVLNRICELAVRVPAAGNTQGLDLVVLEGAETDRYWNASLTAESREKFPWPGLLAAPVLLIPVSDPDAYVERYSEVDKAHSGLGEGQEAWPVPYWYVDSAFSAMVALLAAVDQGLGAVFFGQFDHESAIKQALGIPAERRPVGTIAIGHPTAEQRASQSSTRQRRPLKETLHRGAW